ncbi:hypothetical protein AB3N59_10285 [Leptospira sp. WS92.C1]
MKVFLRFLFCILPLLCIAFPILGDMPLPFPEDLENSNLESGDPAETSNAAGKSEESKQKPVVGSSIEGVPTANQNPNSNESKATNVNSEPQDSSRRDSSETMEESSQQPVKTVLPNSDKTSLRKKKDKKKEDPSESGYKKGVLRLRENQRNNAKTEFSQAGGQGKTSNASRLEDAKLTAENSNDANAITEQIDSEDEKWKAIFEVARSQRGNGKIPEAESQYLRIITEAPENFQSIALLSLGEMLSKTDRKDSARRYLLQLVKLLRKKPELDLQKQQLEKAVTLIARIYADQGKYEDAENWANIYLNQLNPEAPEHSPFVKELKKIRKRRYY